MLPSPNKIDVVISDVGGTIVGVKEYIKCGKEGLKTLLKGHNDTNIGKSKKIKKIGKAFVMYVRHGMYSTYERVHNLVDLVEGLSVQFVERFGLMLANNINEDILELFKYYRTPVSILSMEEWRTVKPIFDVLDQHGLSVDKYIVNMFVVENGIITNKLRSFSNVEGWDESIPLDTEEKKLHGFTSIVQSYGMNPYDPLDMSRILYVTDMDDKIESEIKNHIRKYNGNLVEVSGNY